MTLKRQSLNQLIVPSIALADAGRITECVAAAFAGASSRISMRKASSFALMAR